MLLTKSQDVVQCNPRHGVLRIYTEHTDRNHVVDQLLDMTVEQSKESSPCKKVVVLKRTFVETTPGLLGAGILGHGFSSFGHGVFGQLSG